MSDSNWGGGSSGGSLIGGCFMFMMGLCLLLVGGSCAFGSVSSLLSGGFHFANILGSIFALLIPGAFIAIGIVLIRTGLRSIG